MGNNQKTLLALLAGAAAGAALGLLFAPDRGKETRKKIFDSAKKIKDTLQEKAQEQITNLNEVKEKIYSSVK
jgi:gas vesicle protein